MDRSASAVGRSELWGAAADASSVCCGIGNQGQLGTDDIGDRVLGDSYTFDQKLRLVTSPNVDSQISTTGILSAVYGQMLHSSGGLIYRPGEWS